MPFGLQPWHLIAVAIAALIIFGPARLPEIGRGMGRMLNEFRKGTREMTEGFREEVSTTPPATTESRPTPQPPTQAVPLKGNFCIQCGASNPDGAKFCNTCGAKLPE